MNILNSFTLDNQVIIITGGAGLLGSQYSQAISQAGGIPIVADINAGKEQFYVDVTNKRSVNALIKSVLKKYGKIDGLVNNASLDPKFDKSHFRKHTGSFEDYPLALWNQSLAVDVTGMFLCAQAVAPAMLSQRKGSIVNVSSIYGIVGPDQRLYHNNDPKAPISYKPVTYSVTKSAVLGLTRYLATYWAGKNIRVNALTPGGVFDGHDDEFVKSYAWRTPMGRMAKRDELNGSLLFLLSNASSYMTGSNLVIDGGWSAW